MRGRALWLLIVAGIGMALVGGALAAGRAFAPASAVLAYSSSYDIWLVDLSRALVRPLTRDKSRFLDDSPSWSPDGRRIVFTTVRSFPFNPNLPNGEIAVIGIDGRGLQLLTRERSWDDDPAWSPDGRTIAFRSNRGGESGTAIYLIDLERPFAPPQRVVEDHLRSDLAPSWSRDGRRLILHITIDSRLQVASIDVVSGETEILMPRTAYDPRLSPDGQQIAMWMPAFEGYALHIGAVGETLRAVTETHLNPAPYTWSPDGSFIAFASTEDAKSVVKLLDTASGATTIAFFSPARVSGITWRP